MTANNQNRWSFQYEEINHNWTTGNDYNIEVMDDELVFDSDTGTDNHVPLDIAKVHAEMWSDLFGLTLE